MKRRGKTYLMKAALCCTCIAAATNALAAGPPTPSAFSNPVALVLIFVAVVLLLAIGMLANVLLGAAGFRVESLKEKKQSISTASSTLIVLFLSIISSAAYAQTGDPVQATSEATNSGFGGLSGTTMLVLSGVIALEVIIILAMLGFLKQMLAKDRPVVAAKLVTPKEPLFSVWWKKLNNLQPQTAEATLLLDHDYDGIRELDNKLPPWWLYGFYACIIFSFVYLYRFHVSHSAPSTLEEYQIAMVEAEKEKQAYLASSANNVDETTVKLLTDASALDEGKKIFTSMCAACHGPEGQGTVGPNLTDDYWLHNGTINDVFKTIKYGVPEKGMKSWKDDFSPVQIAAIASYVKSLRGTKPANPKEPQGELFKEENAPEADSAHAVEKRLVQK